MKLIGARVRVAAFCVIAGLAMVATGADAAEYFIPKGHLYTPESETLPPPSSRRAEIEAETDVLETELHREEREARQFLERFRNFIDRDVTTPGYDSDH